MDGKGLREEKRKREEGRIRKEERKGGVREGKEEREG